MKTRKHDLSGYLKGKNTDYYYIKYSGLFIIIFAISFSWFFFAKKSFIWQLDGVQQHYVSLVYYGKFLRQIVREFFASGSIKIPMFDFSIGYGSDISTTLHYYAIGDPLNLLSAIVPSTKTETLYCFLAVLRVYLAGISFSLYCRYMKKPAFNTLCGALIYAFCGFSVLVMVRHPYFSNPMIYFPLLLIGVEKIFARQRPYLFIVMVLISAVSNFYFFYMLTILTVIYAAIRFFALYRQDRIKNLFRQLGRFALFYSTGVLMACLLFLPVVMLAMSSNRASVSNAVGLLYNYSYYEKFASAFITQRTPGYWVYMGFPVVSLVAVILLFTKKKEYPQLKTGFIMLTAFLLLPVAGYILHGFSYVTNRWIWGYSFIVALITATFLPDILQPTRKQLRAASIFSAAYFLYGIFLKEGRSEEFFASAAMLFILVAFMFSRLFGESTQSKLRGVSTVRAGKIIILSFIVFGISVQAFYRFSDVNTGYLSEFDEPGVAYMLQTDNPSALIQDLGDESFFRYETNSFGEQSVNQNSSMLNQQNNIDFYFSLSNPYVSKFLQNDIYYYGDINFKYRGLESRAIPGALADIKYFVVRPSLERYLPYGYDDIVYKSDDYHIYENKYALPLGYAYDYVIPESVYQGLSAIEKQQALLQGAVVHDDALNTLTSMIPQFSHSIIPYEMECGNGILYENGVFIVNNTRSSVKLLFDGLDECETYLGIYGLHFSQTSPIGDPDGEWAGLGLLGKIGFAWDNRLWTAAQRAYLSVKSGNVARTISNSTPGEQFYEGKQNYLVNLLYSEEGKSEIEISFSEPGNYSVDRIEAICLPMDTFGFQVESLKNTALENVSFGVNNITGDITAGKEMLFCFSIPYNGGWRVYIDGIEGEMLNVNTMYNGVFLEAGKHAIELKYTTPYLKQGVVLSIVGLCLFCAIIIYSEKRKPA